MEQRNKNNQKQNIIKSTIFYFSLLLYIMFVLVYLNIDFFNNIKLNYDIDSFTAIMCSFLGVVITVLTLSITIQNNNYYGITLRDIIKLRKWYVGILNILVAFIVLFFSLVIECIFRCNILVIFSAVIATIFSVALFVTEMPYLTMNNSKLTKTIVNAYKQDMKSSLLEINKPLLTHFINYCEDNGFSAFLQLFESSIRRDVAKYVFQFVIKGVKDGKDAKAVMLSFEYLRFLGIELSICNCMEVLKLVNVNSNSINSELIAGVSKRGLYIELFEALIFHQTVQIDDGKLYAFIFEYVFAIKNRNQDYLDVIRSNIGIFRKDYKLMSFLSFFMATFMYNAIVIDKDLTDGFKTWLDDYVNMNVDNLIKIDSWKTVFNNQLIFFHFDERVFHYSDIIFGFFNLDLFRLANNNVECFDIYFSEETFLNPYLIYSACISNDVRTFLQDIKNKNESKFEILSNEIKYNKAVLKLNNLLQYYNLPKISDEKNIAIMNFINEQYVAKSLEKSVSDNDIKKEASDLMKQVSSTLILENEKNYNSNYDNCSSIIRTKQSYIIEAFDVDFLNNIVLDSVYKEVNKTIKSCNTTYLDKPEKIQKIISKKSSMVTNIPKCMLSNFVGNDIEIKEMYNNDIINSCYYMIIDNKFSIKCDVISLDEEKLNKTEINEVVENIENRNNMKVINSFFYTIDEAKEYVEKNYIKLSYELEIKCYLDYFYWIDFEKLL